jgi:hypothetical protein
MNLSDIKRVTAAGPTRFGIYASVGFCKTTIGASFPRPVFEAPENGFPRDLRRQPDRLPTPERWEDVLDHVDFLTDAQHDYETVVYDTLDWLEPVLNAYVCHRDSGRKTELNKGGNKLVSILDYGYGKGEQAAAEEFRNLVRKLDRLQSWRGMHVVVLAHAMIKNFKNPSGPDFDQWVIKGNQHIASIVAEWTENLFYGFHEIEAGKLDDKDRKAKAASTGKRLLGTRQGATYYAKNRIGLADVVEMPADARDLVPILLGEHLSTPATEPAREDAKATHAVADKGLRDYADKVADEVRAPTPAERVQRDERARDSAYENLHRDRDSERREAREWTEPKRPANDAAPRGGKHDPAPSAKVGPTKDDRAPTPPSPTEKPSPEHDRVAYLTRLIVRAGEEKGDKYRSNVERWLKGAKGDADRIEAIIEDVEKTLRQSNSKGAA